MVREKTKAKGWGQTAQGAQAKRKAWVWLQIFPWNYLLLSIYRARILPHFFHFWKVNKSEQGSAFSKAQITVNREWKNPMGPLINPPSLLTNLRSQTHIPMPLPYSSLWVLLFLDFFFFLKLLLILYTWGIAYSIFCMASLLLPVSLITTNATQADFRVCSLVMSTREKIDLYFPAHLRVSPAFSRPPMVEPSLKHFPTEGYTLLPNCPPSTSSVKLDLTSNYSDYTTFVWRVLLPLHFIENNTIQNVQLKSLSQRWEWRF